MPGILTRKVKGVHGSQSKDAPGRNREKSTFRFVVVFDVEQTGEALLFLKSKSFTTSHACAAIPPSHLQYLLERRGLRVEDTRIHQGPDAFPDSSKLLLFGFQGNHRRFPHPSNRHPASLRCDSARWSGQSFGGNRSLEKHVRLLAKGESTKYNR
jgi:hypothetical protein